MAVSLEFLDRPEPFLAAASELLAAFPVEVSVVVTVSDRLRRDLADGVARPAGFPLWWVVERDDDARVVGVGMRTAPFEPHPVHLARFSGEGAEQLVAALEDRGEEVHSVTGAVPAVEQFAAETARVRGSAYRVAEEMSLFELGDLREPALPPGRLRPAGERDVDQVVAWYAAFGREAAAQAGRVEPHPGPEEDRESMLRRIADGTVWLWEDARGVPVHVTGASRPMFGVSRIGPVHTPPEHRGRGYAGATVAGVSRLLLQEGSRVCLFTDRANPISNALYERLGFRRVADHAHLVIE